MAYLIPLLYVLSQLTCGDYSTILFDFLYSPALQFTPVAWHVHPIYMII